MDYNKKMQEELEKSTQSLNDAKVQVAIAVTNLENSKETASYQSGFLDGMRRIITLLEQDSIAKSEKNDE